MKKLILIFLTFIFLFKFDIASASTNTYQRTEDDMGVNKKWEINEKNKGAVFDTPRVDASEKVYDYADIVSDADEYRLFVESNKFIQATKMDMVILTTDLDYSDSELEDYAANFYDYNDFGTDDKLYSGIIFIINMNENNRYYNIYTFGNAQLYFPYERCEELLDKMSNDIQRQEDYLQDRKYYEAMSTFTEYSKIIYERGIPDNYENYYVDDNGVLRKTLVFPWLICFIISLVITIVVMVILISKNKMIKKAGPAKEYLDRNSIDYTIRDNRYISTNTTSVIIKNTNVGSGGGSRMGSSGGGHGGGGGRHF